MNFSEAIETKNIKNKNWMNDTLKIVLQNVYNISTITKNKCEIFVGSSSHKHTHRSQPRGLNTQLKWTKITDSISSKFLSENLHQSLSNITSLNVFRRFYCFIYVHYSLQFSFIILHITIPYTNPMILLYKVHWSLIWMWCGYSLINGRKTIYWKILKTEKKHSSYKGPHFGAVEC